MVTTTHRGRWTLDDRLTQSVRKLPVDVPPGTAAVIVQLKYDKAPHRVLDLGCVSVAGFRGWSGGARSRFTIAADWATPGYLPGELEPGTWHVLLRLHRVPPAGIDYELTASTTATPPRPPGWPAPPSPPIRPPRRDIPDIDGRRWLAGDLHAHTVHSDGELTVVELACLAAERGLQFLAVTDHNTVSQHADLASAATYAGIALVPGQEVTTDLGHANVIGPVGWVDFREPPDTWIAAADQAGGVLSINHPIAGDCAWRLALAGPPVAAEVWHGGSWLDRRWGGPLAWLHIWHRAPVAIGGSDFHLRAQGRFPGEPTTWILADGDDVIGGLRAGRTAVSASPADPLLLRFGDEMLALDADGTVFVPPHGGPRVVRGDRVRLSAGSGLHRLETHENEVVALCQ